MREIVFILRLNHFRFTGVVSILPLVAALIEKSVDIYYINFISADPRWVPLLDTLVAPIPVTHKFGSLLYQWYAADLFIILSSGVLCYWISSEQPDTLRIRVRSTLVWSARILILTTILTLGLKLLDLYDERVATPQIWQNGFGQPNRWPITVAPGSHHFYSTIDTFLQPLLLRDGLLIIGPSIGLIIACIIIGSCAQLPSLLRQRRSSAWNAAGLCRSCGYDMRASVNSCPECGTAKIVRMSPTVKD